jgi:hypothetical protein
VARAHALAEPVGALALAIVGLVRAFHATALVLDMRESCGPDEKESLSDSEGYGQAAP